MILTAGQAAGVERRRRPARSTPAAGNGGADRVLVVAPVRTPRRLPGRWYGFDAADVVVVDTNDPAIDDPAAARRKALIDWVRQGGHLVVAVGQNWQAVRTARSEPLLPGVPAGPGRAERPGPDRAVRRLGNKPLIAAGSQVKILVTKFEGWEARGGIAARPRRPPPRWSSAGPYGFGRVTMVGLDVDQKPFSAWEEKKLFWDKVLDLRGRGSADAAIATGRRRLLQHGRSSDLRPCCTTRSSGSRACGSCPFGWVAFFVFLYILLIGPGDYFFLKKVVKRMEMTWVTFPLIVIAVSAAGLRRGLLLQGHRAADQQGGRRGRRPDDRPGPGLDLADALQPAEPRLRRRRSPRCRPRPSPPTTRWSPESTPAGGANAETLIDLVRHARRPAACGGGLSLRQRRLRRTPPMSEPEELQGVRVPIWSTKSFSGRWSGPADAPGPGSRPHARRPRPAPRHRHEPLAPDP